MKQVSFYKKNDEIVDICKDTFVKYGCEKSEATQLFRFITRTCNVTTRQIEKIIFRNGKEYKSLLFMQFIAIDELKRCVDNMLTKMPNKRISRDKWRRISELVSAIEAGHCGDKK